MRRLAVIGPLAVLATALATHAIVTFGPTPQRVTEHPDILDPLGILIDTRDRWVLLSWWLLAAAMLALSVRPHRRDGSGPLASHAWIGVIVCSAALAVTLASLMLDRDAAGLFPGLTVPALVAGGLASALVLALWLLKARSSVLVSAALIILAVVVAVPALAQGPHSVRDLDSFRFTATELAAPAAGSLPWAPFVPQYTTVLGMPIAPLLRAWPDSALWIILVWLLLLQLAALTVAVGVSVRCGGWRMAAPATLLVVLPVIATNEMGINAGTYFAGMPLRVALPVGLLVVVIWALGDPTLPSRTSLGRVLALGLVAGVTVLNNLDFGVPAALATSIVILASWPRGDALPRLAVFVLGTMSVPAGYLALLAGLGQGPDVSAPGQFVSVFGAEGYFNVAMGPAGLHVPVAALFITTSVIGLLLLRARSRRASRQRRRGLALGYVGTWSLLTLPYFTGRSVTATLLAGFALQIGLCVALLLPLIRTAIVRRGGLPSPWRPWVAGSGALGFVAMSACLACLTLVYSPTAYLSFRNDPGQSPADVVLAESRALTDALESAPDSQLRAAVDAGRVSQWLPYASFVSLRTSVPSGLIASSPDYLGLSTRFSDRQCAQVRTSETEFVVMSDVTRAALARAPGCAGVLALDSAIPVWTTPELVAVPVLR